jgi:hypothetical protein
MGTGERAHVAGRHAWIAEEHTGHVSQRERAVVASCGRTSPCSRTWCHGQGTPRRVIREGTPVRDEARSVSVLPDHEQGEEAHWSYLLDPLILPLQGAVSPWIVSAHDGQRLEPVGSIRSISARGIQGDTRAVLASAFTGCAKVAGSCVPRVLRIQGSSGGCPSRVGTRASQT